MRHYQRVGRASLVAALLVLGPAAAAAQDRSSVPMPRVDVSAGYTFMRDFSDLPEDLNFPAGWYAAAGVNLTRWFGIVGEATGSYKRNFDVTEGFLSFSNDASVYTLMGGPRFSGKVGRVVPHVQFLAGGAHLRLTTVFPEELQMRSRMTFRDTQFAFQPGGGVTILVTDRFGVRLAGDYRCIIDFVKGDENDYTNEFRLLAGFTLNWGSR